jgi:hypothetical protein
LFRRHLLLAHKARAGGEQLLSAHVGEGPIEDEFCNDELMPAANGSRNLWMGGGAVKKCVMHIMVAAISLSEQTLHTPISWWQQYP